MGAFGSGQMGFAQMGMQRSLQLQMQNSFQQRLQQQQAIFSQYQQFLQSLLAQMAQQPDSSLQQSLRNSNALVLWAASVEIARRRQGQLPLRGSLASKAK